MTLTNFIVCPHCASVYRFQQGVRERDGTTHVLKCSNRLFGCGLPKYSKNKSAGDINVIHLAVINDEKYYPLKIFCYK